MNPSIPAERLERERRLDPSRFAREYEAEFPEDLETLLPSAWFEQAIVPGRHELPAREGVGMSRPWTPRAAGPMPSLGLVVAATVAQATFLRSAGLSATGNGRSYLPTLHRDSKGMIYLAWTDARRQKYDLYLARSKDGGRTWSDEIRIDAAKTPEVESAGPVFAEGKGGVLHAVWFATHADKDVRVLHAASRDQGVTWSPPRQLNVSLGVGYEPQIASDGAGHLYVTWYERRASTEVQTQTPQSGIKLAAPQLYDVYFAASDDDGGSWRAPVRLNPRDNSPMALRPQIAYGGTGHVYLLWQETEVGRPLGVYVAASSDHGTTWPVRGLKIDGTNRGTTAPRLVADHSGHVYAAWNDSREVTFAVYFNTSADHGRTWLPQDVRLGHTPPGKHHSIPPRLAVSSSGRVFVTWIDSRNHAAADMEGLNRNDVFLTASDDYGKTWRTRDVRLNTGAPGSTGAGGQQIVSDLEGRRVAVAWSDNRTRRGRVYLTYSTDGGRTWLKTEILVDKDATPAQRGLAPRCSWDRTERCWCPGRSAGPMRPRTDRGGARCTMFESGGSRSPRQECESLRGGMLGWCAVE